MFVGLHSRDALTTGLIWWHWYCYVFVGGEEGDLLHGMEGVGGWKGRRKREKGMR